MHRSDDESVMHMFIANIRVVGAAATSSLSRVLRAVDPLLATRVHANGDGVEDVIRALQLIEGGATETVN